MHKVERQLQLVALLLDSPDPLTYEQVRERFPAYDQDDDESAKRMFERDKDDLRAMGVPIELVAVDAWESAEGYAISADRYYLPNIEFTPEEASALMVLAATPDEDDAAVQGLRKLIYGAQDGPLGLGGSLVAAGPDTAGGALAAVWAAMRRGRSIGFGYRTSSGKASRRSVDPFALVTRSLRWYVVGRDRDHDEIRAFRISRVTSPVEEGPEALARPEEFHAADHVTGPWERSEDDGPGARVAVDERVAWWAARTLYDAEIVGPHDAGRVLIGAPMQPGVLEWVLSLGSEAEALEPEALRAQVIEVLEGMADV
ncbi:MAG: WYL domain-containing protein [Actinomycetota bacterium]